MSQDVYTATSVFNTEGKNKARCTALQALKEAFPKAHNIQMMGGKLHMASPPCATADEACQWAVRSKQGIISTAKKAGLTLQHERTFPPVRLTDPALQRQAKKAA